MNRVVEFQVIVLFLIKIKSQQKILITLTK